MSPKSMPSFFFATYLFLTSSAVSGASKMTSATGKKITLSFCSTLALIVIPQPTALSLQTGRHGRANRRVEFFFKEKNPAFQTRCTTFHFGLVEMLTSNVSFKFKFCLNLSNNKMDFGNLATIATESIKFIS